MAHTIKALAISIGAALALTSLPSHAEITLLKQDPQAGDPLSRLNFTVGGSIRPQFNMMTGDGDKGSYKRNGFDGGTRFRFAADYYLFDDISWISYYELGVNIPALFDWDNHYAEGANNTTRRMLYTGLKSDTWGTLTYGQQNSIYYDVVGVKTDIWDYDMIGQAPGNGINGDYDGSYRSRNMLKYKKTVGDVDLYGSYLFEDSEYLPGNGLRYKRKGGGSVGADYHIMKDLTWGTAWNGWCLTARISVSPRSESGCSLSDILIPDAPEKYFLSSEQTEKLLYKSLEGRRDTGSTTRKE